MHNMVGGTGQSFVNKCVSDYIHIQYRTKCGYKQRMVHVIKDDIKKFQAVIDGPGNVTKF